MPETIDYNPMLCQTDVLPETIYRPEPDALPELGYG